MLGASGFVSGVGSETLPIYIFSQLRFGVSPEVNATAAMILGLTLAAIVVAYLILRRTSQAREGTSLPGV